MLIKSCSINFFCPAVYKDCCSKAALYPVRWQYWHRAPLNWLGTIAEIVLQLCHFKQWYFCHFTCSHVISLTRFRTSFIYLSCQNIFSGYKARVLNWCKAVVSHMSNQGFHSLNLWYICGVKCFNQNQPYTLLFANFLLKTAMTSAGMSN